MQQQQQYNVNEGLKVPHYNIDLDLPAQERWEQPIKDFKDQILHVDKIIDQTIDIPSIVKNIIGWFKSKVYYIEELTGMAKLIGFDLNKLIMLQLIYEANAHCTSIVSDRHNNKNQQVPIHARTMEWEMDFLRPLTIDVTFIKNNIPIAQGTTWVGYVGILTGMSLIQNKQYSVSVNFRISGDSFMKNIKESIVSSWPIGFLVRETLCDFQLDFRKACQILNNSDLIAPVYFTVCGREKNEGIIITRNRKISENQIQLSQQNEFLTQTNIDHWTTESNDEDIAIFVERINHVKTNLSKINKNKGQINPIDLWKIMSKDPIMSDIVVYGTVMIPAEGFYETRLTVGRGNKLTFIPKSLKQIQEAEEKEKCIRCGYEYYESLNSKGMCVHQGQWHATYQDCNKFKCLKGLGLSNVGKQHYGCCFSTDPNSKCPKSDYHDS